MRIATVNVNGIRAAWRKGMPAWVEANEPDVILLQEVRAPEEIPQQLFAELGEDWHVVTHPCQIKGRAGVAVASRGCEELEVRHGVNVSEPDVDTGRWLEVDLEKDGVAFTVVSAYLHSGQVGTEKQEQKMAHLKLVDTTLAAMLARNDQGLALVGGDLNIVASEQDIKNWQGNHNKTSGVLDEEIEHVQRWLDQGWVDVLRAQVGQQQGPYSWWSWRGKAFDNDAGWRIDYQLATPVLAGCAEMARVDRAAAYDQRWSDHAPVVIDYDLSEFAQD